MNTITITIDTGKAKAFLRALWWALFWMASHARMYMQLALVIAKHDRLWQVDKMRIHMRAHPTRYAIEQWVRSAGGKAGGAAR
ncbi:MAG: hypothetical protein ABFD94_04260 [Armatimonadia bacterium]